MKVRRSTSLAAAALVVIPLVLASPCVLSDSSGTYDLRPLQRKGSDYKVRNGENGDEYLLNFCGPIQSSTWAVDRSETVGAYFEEPRGGISLGQWNETASNNEGVLSLRYLSGTACPNSSAKRSSIIQLQCDTSWTAGSPLLVGVIDDCSYFFSFKTPHACPVSIVASAWSAILVFLSFVIIAALVSFLSATTYNRLVLRKRGTEQFPSASKLSDSLAFIKDMTIIAVIGTLHVLANAWERMKSWRFRERTAQGVDYTRGAWSRAAREGLERVPSGVESGKEEGVGRERFRDEEG